MSTVLIRCLLFAGLALLLSVPSAYAQAPEAAPPVPAFLAGAYPQRETDPAAVARGRTAYTAYGCAFCHGEDTRGGSGGPSLLRSGLVQRDRAGETIADVILNGVPNTSMVGFPLQGVEIADIAEFLHSFALDSRDPARQPPPTIVTGNERAGRRYFNQYCDGCHSPTGDLRGVAARYPDPRRLQQNWLMPENAPPIRARVSTEPAEIEGELVRIDEFNITLRLADGRQRTFKREGDLPAIVLEDPLAGHKDLLSVYTDRDIHNVTAYLVTLE